MSRLDLVLTPLRGVVRALKTTRRTVAAVPDVVEAILVLPHLSRQLEEVRFSTATLPEMLEEIRRVHADTSTLPVMHDELERMGRVTAWIPPRRNGRPAPRARS
jgi:hypothetical protein